MRLWDRRACVAVSTPDFSRHLATLLEVARGVTPVSRSRHAAGMIYKNKLLVVGTNKEKSHPIAAAYGRNPLANTLHAEVDCLVRWINRYGKEELVNCTMLVVRTLANGQPANSCPCIGCQRALVGFRVGRLYYTTGIKEELKEYSI